MAQITAALREQCNGQLQNRYEHTEKHTNKQK